MSKPKETKEIYIPSFCFNISKHNKYTKLKTSNSIQYKHQERTFQTLNKFFPCYIK